MAQIKWNKATILGYLFEVATTLMMLAIVHGIFYMILHPFGINTWDCPIWMDILIVCISLSLYEWLMWYFRICFFLTVDGKIRYVIKGLVVRRKRK